MGQHVGLGVGPGARVLGYASPSFDASVLEMLMAVTSRGAVVLRPVEAVGGGPWRNGFPARGDALVL